MPKNTPLGLAIAVAAGLSGFGMVWHIWWLAAFGLVAIVALIILRSFEKEIEYEITV